MAYRIAVRGGEDQIAVSGHEGDSDEDLIPRAFLALEFIHRARRITEIVHDNRSGAAEVASWWAKLNGVPVVIITGTTIAERNDKILKREPFAILIFDPSERTEKIVASAKTSNIPLLNCDDVSLLWLERQSLLESLPNRENVDRAGALTGWLAGRLESIGAGRGFGPETIQYVVKAYGIWGSPGKSKRRSKLWGRFLAAFGT